MSSKKNEDDEFPIYCPSCKKKLHEVKVFEYITRFCINGECELYDPYGLFHEYKKFNENLTEEDKKMIAKLRKTMSRT